MRGKTRFATAPGIIAARHGHGVLFAAAAENRKVVCSTNAIESLNAQYRWPGAEIY